MSNHNGNEVSMAMVSEATRRDAKPATFSSKYESFTEEYRDLKKRKAALEFQMRSYNKVAFSNEQRKIREKFPAHKSLNEWIKRRSQLESEKNEKIREIGELNNRMIQIKPRVMLERNQDRNGSGLYNDNGDMDRDECLLRMLKIQQRILLAVESMASKFGVGRE